MAKPSVPSKPLPSGSDSRFAPIFRLLQTPDEKASAILAAGAAAWKYLSYWEHIDFLLSIREEKFSVMFDFMQNAGWAILLVIGIAWYVISYVSGSTSIQTGASTWRLIASCSLVAFLFGVIMTIRASGTVPNIIAGWGGDINTCNALLDTSRLSSFREDYKLGLICGIQDPTIDMLEDKRIITSNLFTISPGGVSIVATNVRQPDQMRQLPQGATVSLWHAPVLIPNGISMDKIQTLGDEQKLGGKIVAGAYWK
jgi:uncharacterized membrane protein YhdT